MKIIRLTIICLLYSIICPQIYSQQIRRNAYGKKMIRSVKVDNITEDGNVSNRSFNDIYTLDYFPNGELRSVEQSWKSDEGRRAERIFIEDDKLHFESFLNGKKNPNVSATGNINFYKDSESGGKKYSLNSMTQTFKEYVYGELCYVRIVKMYDNNKVYRLSFDGKHSLEKELISINRNPHNLVECEGDQSPFPYTNSLYSCGFNGYRLLAEGDDGILYTHYMTTEIARTPIGKNYYHKVPNPFVSYECGDIFLPRKNDTNVNFQFLFYRDDFELITEWGNLKSQDLIFKEDCFGDHWHYKWDYQFDSSDNITGIIMYDRTLEWLMFKVDIEYVYE